MAALIYLLKCMVYFVCVGLDVAMFFLQIRLILRWKKIAFLVPFDKTGQPLVAAVTKKVSMLFQTRPPLSEKGKLIVALVIAALARIILGTLF